MSSRLFPPYGNHGRSQSATNPFTSGKGRSAPGTLFSGKRRSASAPRYCGKDGPGMEEGRRNGDGHNLSRNRTFRGDMGKKRTGRHAFPHTVTGIGIVLNGLYITRTQLLDEVNELLASMCHNLPKTEIAKRIDNLFTHIARHFMDKETILAEAEDNEFPVLSATSAKRYPPFGTSCAKPASSRQNVPLSGERYR